MQGVPEVLQIPIGNTFDFPLQDSQYAICLSGGGYRAALFHAGVLWRANELGLLEKTDRIVGVSGGAITAAVVGMNWKQLRFVDGRATNFREVVVDPLLGLTDRTVEVWAVVRGLLTPATTTGQQLAGYYNRLLFSHKTLDEFPSWGNGPQIILLASEMRAGTHWYMSRYAVGSQMFGFFPYPSMEIATAVAASSAFPPFLAPVSLTGDIDEMRAPNWSPSPPDYNGRLTLTRWLDPEVAREHEYNVEVLKDADPKVRENVWNLISNIFDSIEASDRAEFGFDKDFARRIELEDGGVLSNTGFEACYGSPNFIVSSAAVDQREATPAHKNWISTTVRTIDLIHTRAEESAYNRISSVIDVNKCVEPVEGEKKQCRAFVRLAGGAALNALKYRCDYDSGLEKASVDTRLGKMRRDVQEHLINWGYLEALASLEDQMGLEGDKVLPFTMLEGAPNASCQEPQLYIVR